MTGAMVALSPAGVAVALAWLAAVAYVLAWAARKGWKGAG